MFRLIRKFATGQSTFLCMLVGATFAAQVGPTQASEDKVYLAIQLAQQAFKCKTGIRTAGSAKSADDIDWRGDAKRFSVFFQRTSATNEPDAPAYTFRGGTYTSFNALLTFKTSGRRLTVTCKKPACLAHEYAESGCDENGLCANVGAGSAKKEYINGFYIDLCDGSAAKDVADGLRFISEAKAP